MRDLKHLVRHSTAALGVALAVNLGGGTSTPRAAEYTMKLGLVTLNDMQHNFANKYKEVVEKATNGRIEVKVFPQSQLGSPAAQIEGLQLGTVEMFMIVTDFLAGVDRRLTDASMQVNAGQQHRVDLPLAQHRHDVSGGKGTE